MRIGASATSDDICTPPLEALISGRFTISPNKLQVDELAPEAAGRVSSLGVVGMPFPLLCS